MKIKKIYKYGTGEIVPEGAIYLCTKTEEDLDISGNFEAIGKVYGCDPHILVEKRNILVWHYFLVEVEEKEN